MSLTITESIDELKIALMEYIEATYHISDPVVVAQRKRILQTAGNIFQEPFLESTPRYSTGESFSNIDLGVAANDLFQSLAERGPDRVLFDPPYQHQADAIKKSIVEGRDLIIATGTGSGKTEAFLLPILVKTLREAELSGAQFGSTSAVRSLVLYPMNALVNDQLARIRNLYADRRVVNKFVELTGRPLRFARYTSRTPYAGVRDSAKDISRINGFLKYFLNLSKLTDDNAPANGTINTNTLESELRSRGRWPAKPDLEAWLGKPKTRWKNTSTGEYQRGVTLPLDSELITRHEVQANPPDVLITNYSMLEYMLIRPVERVIFDKTADWLANNPSQKLMLILDEVHLYRGSGGAEVGLLIRRLAARLGVSLQRIQVICTSASFSPENAKQFVSDLTGKPKDGIDVVTGQLAKRASADPGDDNSAELLLTVSIEQFLECTNNAERFDSISEFLKLRGVTYSSNDHVGTKLKEALEEFKPLNFIINKTMGEAVPLNEIGRMAFPDTSAENAQQAITVLLILAGSARTSNDDPGLLPSRIHTFFRGLPGLWACIDPNCKALTAENRGGSTGKLFGQPRLVCEPECGHRVYEYFSCRNCGSSHARVYVADPSEHSSHTWSEPGENINTASGFYEELSPLDILLISPMDTSKVIPAEIDLITGRINPPDIKAITREVYVRNIDNEEQSEEEENVDDSDQASFTSSDTNARLITCAVCKDTGFGRGAIQNHQTSGDEPFQALINKQIEIQPPNPDQPETPFAPLRGRKCLIFSDSRQTAARLAPNLQRYSTRDALRASMLRGFKLLEGDNDPQVSKRFSIADFYLAAILGSIDLGVRLQAETIHGEFISDLESVNKNGNSDTLEFLWDFRAKNPPDSFLRDFRDFFRNTHYSYESLGLAFLKERTDNVDIFTAMPDLPGLADTPESKKALSRLWLQEFARQSHGIWLDIMPPEWRNNEIRPHRSGRFPAIKRTIGNSQLQQTFDASWIPNLIDNFGERLPSGDIYLNGKTLQPDLHTDTIGYCQTCRRTVRAISTGQNCPSCGEDSIEFINPNKNQIFSTRKNYYRRPTAEAITSGKYGGVNLMTAEHTAQLNSAVAEESFSRAEEYELRFQDVNLNPGNNTSSALDVLSSTTTMEVGIDIGSLSGVALRNVPPQRSNYQQRAGRAGRRANSIATVISFASSDSHDENYFKRPGEMISGPPEAPFINIDNAQIARRHILAFLLQEFHRAVLNPKDAESNPHLFDVLGTVQEFLNDESQFNMTLFENWMAENKEIIASKLALWLPDQLNPSDRQFLINNFRSNAIDDITHAIGEVNSNSQSDESNSTDDQTGVPVEDDSDPHELMDEESGNPSRLLNRLMDQGALPKYSFPTDIASLYVFDTSSEGNFRPKFQYSPSQGLATALSQYAPGKDIWIDNKMWESSAIYSPVPDERFDAWSNRRFYYECNACGYAKTMPKDQGTLSEKTVCDACGNAEEMEQARWWFRPPGFAHKYGQPPITAREDIPETSYATRAKLSRPTPPDNEWIPLNPRLKIVSRPEWLLITNRGSKNFGYSYCTSCGMIEPAIKANSVLAGDHEKPFPSIGTSDCVGSRISRGMVLGTDFLTDVALLSISTRQPISLRPGMAATSSILRTVAEALSSALTEILGIDSDEIQAEFRPALTDDGRTGSSAEIYLYDTLAGGAGYSSKFADHGIETIERALKVLNDCPSDCDASCYRCMRSYRNKFEHRLLNRHLGIDLLNFLLNGELPELRSDRIKVAEKILVEDLTRQFGEIAEFPVDHILDVPGLGKVELPIWVQPKNGTSGFGVVVTNALTPEYLGPEIEQASDIGMVPIRGVDESLIALNLPEAVNRVGNILPSM